MNAVLMLVTLTPIYLQADQEFSARKVTDVKPTGVAKPILDVLSKDSVSLMRGDKEIAHLWAREAIDSTAAGGSLPGYDSVAEGSLAGVYEVKADGFTDFRGQAIPQGIYVLRVHQHPQDGNHMGVAPTPQFLTLTPKDTEKKLEPPESKTLLEMSKKVADTGHPVALYVEPYFEEPTGEFPRVRKNDLEHMVLDVMMKAKNADGELVDFPWGIVFVGKTEAE